MKIIHRISINTTRKQVKKLNKQGFSLEEGVNTFLIEEWKEGSDKIIELAKSMGAVDIVTTTFTDKELNEAKFIAINAKGHHGYPQPEDNFEYLKCTYDGLGCSDCGVGFKQVNSFSIKHTKNFFKNGFHQLNWVFDEFFIEKGIYKEVFEPLGVRFSEVRDFKTQEIVTNHVQLLIPPADEELVLKGDNYETCNTCGSKKYLPITRGFFPKFKSDNISQPIFKSKEYFGSGASAYKAVFISNELYKKLDSLKIIGLNYTAVTS